MRDTLFSRPHARDRCPTPAFFDLVWDRLRVGPGSANGNDFVLEADASKLGNVHPDQTFTAKVTVVGVAQTQDTVSGGTGEVPDFDASTFTVTG